MKLLLPALLVVALPCAALAQVRDDDPRIIASGRAYEACINSKIAMARAMRGDHQWLQKLVEAECKTEADALYGVVLEWSREQNPGASDHNTIAAFYVSKVMLNRVYGAGPAAFGGRDSSSGDSADPFQRGGAPPRR